MYGVYASRLHIQVNAGRKGDGWFGDGGVYAAWMTGKGEKEEDRGGKVRGVLWGNLCDRW
jgi:hypothetical protein